MMGLAIGLSLWALLVTPVMGEETPKASSASETNSLRRIAPLDSLSSAASSRKQATWLSHAGEHEQALEVLTKAIERFPDDSGIYWQRAGLYVQLERYEEAIADYRQVSRLVPMFVEPYGVRGGFSS